MSLFLFWLWLIFWLNGVLKNRIGSYLFIFSGSRVVWPSWVRCWRREEKVKREGSARRKGNGHTSVCCWRPHLFLVLFQLYFLFFFLVCFTAASKRGVHLPLSPVKRKEKKKTKEKGGWSRWLAKVLLWRKPPIHPAASHHFLRSQRSLLPTGEKKVLRESEEEKH